MRRSDGMITALAPAKVNLWLHVLAREESGFHQLDTLFCALDLADRLDVAHAEELDVLVEGPELGPIERNLVFRAAQAFYAAVPDASTRARIRLVKQIPHGAGLGGGSSDAAATLRALNALHDEPLKAAALLAIAEDLGSDIPFFLGGSPLALAWGRGERLLPLRPPPPAPVLVVTPPFNSPTGPAYAALAQRRTEQPTRRSACLVDLPSLRRWATLAELAGNDFEDVLFEMHATLATVKETLRSRGASIALLAGSGSSLFGVFPRATTRDRAATYLAERFPEYRITATSTAATLPALQRASVDSTPASG